MYIQRGSWIRVFCFPKSNLSAVTSLGEVVSGPHCIKKGGNTELTETSNDFGDREGVRKWYSPPIMLT